jgi:cysteine desulfurase
MRSGTLNVTGIVGLGRACEVARDEMKKEGERLSVLRDRLLDSLLALPGTSLNGAREHLLPHAFNISFGSVESQVLISRLNKHLAVSSGSACTSATLEPSYVLRALGIGDERAAGSLRFSLGRPTKEDEITMTIQTLREVIESLRH